MTDEHTDPTPSAVPDTSGEAKSPTDDNTLAMLAHLLGILTGFLGPLIIWLVKKEVPFVERHAREALNFQLTMLIGWIVASATAFILVGCILMPILFIITIVFCIMAAMAANKGEEYKYPLNIRFISG